MGTTTMKVLLIYSFTSSPVYLSAIFTAYTLQIRVVFQNKEIDKTKTSIIMTLSVFEKSVAKSKVTLLHNGWLLNTQYSSHTKTLSQYPTWFQYLRAQWPALLRVSLRITQGSTLTVVRLGIPSSFCCRTTWICVYGCPLVKLRKLIK